MPPNGDVHHFSLLPLTVDLFIAIPRAPLLRFPVSYFNLSCAAYSQSHDQMSDASNSNVVEALVFNLVCLLVFSEPPRFRLSQLIGDKDA